VQPSAAFSRSSAGLVETRSPGGGVMVDLQGRFQSPLIATVGTDGQVRFPPPASRRMTPSTMRTSRRLLGAVLLFALGASAQGATITIINDDSPGEGFNDATAVSPIGGNSATTRGGQRLAAFQFAASLWGAELVSGITIQVGANMDPLDCDSSGAVLGQAGPNTVHADFTHAPVGNTWYPAALANKLAASDLSARTTSRRPSTAPSARPARSRTSGTTGSTGIRRVARSTSSPSSSTRSATVSVFSRS
jgi:hypothetical protein